MLQIAQKNKNLKIKYIVDVMTEQNTIISVQLHHIQRLSGIRLQMEEYKNLSDTASKKKLSMVLRECLKRNGDNLQELHPIKHLNISDPALVQIYAKIEDLKGIMDKMKEAQDDDTDLDALCAKYVKKKDLECEIRGVEEEIVSLQNNQHIEEQLSGMRRVLRRLNMD